MIRIKHLQQWYLWSVLGPRLTLTSYSPYLLGGPQAVLKTDERYASLEGAAMYAEEPVLFFIERCIAEGKQKLSKSGAEAEARG
jgi:hypothetical protein